ncbi:MAG TPA: sensor histidine kinase [Firmicutes bacterium]|nr:sensor histidine kinase [Bacillota bacterium]
MLEYTSPAEERRAHQALRFYRYISWALTSAMYLLDAPRYNLGIALGVVTALLLAGHLASKFYQSVGLTKSLAVSLILIETIGIALLLVPTGGLNSPFIWYALNPILMAALMLAVPYCWLVLVAFLSAATFGSVLLYREPLQEVWSGRSWVIAAFVMITTGASVFSYLMTALRKAYTQLGEMHREAERLLVVKEQNRIANEIHDGVSQHLFSIVYALHGLRQRNTHIQDQETQEQLQLISATATRAAQELRASIYRIKPSPSTKQAFIATLAAQLEDMARLNDIRINLETEGSEDVVSPALRQAITRIIKEAVANAIRHGRCSRVDIELAMQPGSLELEIADDGIGFEPHNRRRRGLGLSNMVDLAANFNGSLHITSAPGKGTCVSCRIPAANE